MRSRIKRNNHLRLEIQSLTYLNMHSLSHKNVFEKLISKKVHEKAAIDKAISEFCLVIRGMMTKKEPLTKVALLI